MANTVIALKKSATPSAAPVDLANGELAINYADGKLFYKHANGTISTITSSVGNSFGTVNANNTLVVSDTPGDVITFEPGTNINIVGDAINDKITISLKNDVIIPSTGTFKVAAVGGDEGGEIKLANAITNSVLSGDVIIDVYQNRLRFYESGGTNRGAFIDLSISGTGVSSNLLAGGTGGTTDTVARDTASAAFDRANSANVLAFNTGIGANAFTSATISGANTAVGTGANAYANLVWSRSNTYADTVGTSANAFMIAVQNGSNTAIGTGANAFTSATIAGANTAVGTGANAFTSATISGANTAVGAGANAFTSATIAGANTAVGTGANAFTSATIAGANTAVGSGANAFTSATIAGANTAVGAGANAYANLVWSRSNTRSDAIGVSANAFTSATIEGANTAVGLGANTYANATFVRLTAASQTITGNVNIVGNLTLSGNTFAIDATRLEVDDPLIYLAANNYTSDIVDIGFIANYVNATGQNVHTGLYREHEDKMYYLFQGYDKEPINNHLGALSNNMTLAVLNADLRTSNLVLGGANAILTIGAAFDKANSTTYTSNVVISVADNTNAALRITQTGTGDAIRVEDSANPDSTPFVVDANGNVGIGRTSPALTYRLDVRTPALGADGVAVAGPTGVIALHPSTAGGNFNPLVSANDQSIIFYGGSSGAGSGTGNLIIAPWSTSSVGIKIDYNGNVLIGRTTSTVGNNVKLDVNGAINASAVLINGTPALPNTSGVSFNGNLNFPTGNVGIGTATPSSRLEVLGDVPNSLSNLGTGDAATITITNANVSGLNRIAKTLYEIGNLPIASIAGAYTVFNAGGNIGGDLIFSTQSHVGTGVQERMRIDANGNVGIGTTSPLLKLDVSGSSIQGIRVISTDTSGSNIAYFTAQHGSGSSLQLRAGTGYTYLLSTSAVPLYMGTNSAIHMTVADTGNVGIGTTTVPAQLTIVGAGQAVVSNFNTANTLAGTILVGSSGTASQDGGAIVFSAASTAWRFAAIKGHVLNGTSNTVGDITFQTRRVTTDPTLTETLRVSHTGNVLIGRTTSTVGQGVILDVAGGINASAIIASTLLAGSASSDIARLRFLEFSNISYIQSGTQVTGSGRPIHFTKFNSVDATMVVDIANGNVGIGTTSPAYKLEVAGSFAAQTKSFVINHPSKSGMMLRHGSLEGPENGVYVRGRLEGKSIIELPDYWWNLIDESTITVNLTPIGRSQDIWVQSTSAYFIHLNQPVDCFFTVFAERKDVDKLVVEY